MPSDETALIAEQISHALDLMKADLSAIKAEADHRQEFNTFRLKALEDQGHDHETRIRSAHDGVVQFKLFSGLASGGSSILATVALIKAFFGGR
jgi:hypothetical protein